MVPAMTEKERVVIGGIELEAALTSGGLGTMCETYEGRVQRLDYKTMRYPGHFELMQFFFDELGLRDRRELAGRDPGRRQAAGGRRRRLPARRRRGRPTARATPRPASSPASSTSAPTSRCAINGRIWRAISWTTAASAVAVVELVAAGRLPAAGFIKQEDIPLERLLATSNGARFAELGHSLMTSLEPDVTTLPRHEDLIAETSEILDRLGRAGCRRRRPGRRARPITGGELARAAGHTRRPRSREIVGAAHDAFAHWRTVPAPVRGQLVRELGELLREHKDDLGALVSIEAGKILSEGLGEVQEMIDICDLAVGLSRQLFGLTIATERPGHRMMEQWHPLGVVGVISAFNFPVAVWSWNAALAFVCGDAVVWKPSEKTLLTALACQALVAEAARRVGAPGGVCPRCVGGAGRRRGAGRRPAGRAALRDRFDPHGPGGRAAGGRPLRPAAARAGRQQRRDRRAVGRPRPGRARHRVLGGRHRRPALHLAAPGHRARVDRRRAGRTAGAPPTRRCRSARRWPTARWSAR